MNKIYIYVKKNTPFCSNFSFYVDDVVFDHQSETRVTSEPTKQAKIHGKLNLVGVLSKAVQPRELESWEPGVTRALPTPCRRPGPLRGAYARPPPSLRGGFASARRKGAQG